MKQPLTFESAWEYIERMEQQGWQTPLKTMLERKMAILDAEMAERAANARNAVKTTPNK